MLSHYFPNRLTDPGLVVYDVFLYFVVMDLSVG
jgi:hypothetical protein